MTPSEARDLEPGDLVTAPLWDKPQVVDHVNHENFHADPMVFFKKGGFWRSSALKRVKAVGA